MPLVKATNHDLFFHLQSLTKADALSELVDLIAERRPIPDAAVIKEKILAREELMSTGIGLGIGVPHVRLDHLKHPLAAVGISRVGIADYGSLDDQPVRIICMILVPVGGAPGIYSDLIADRDPVEG